MSFRLWLDRGQEGSIVITASMSAQIINQAARNTPLTQVRNQLLLRISFGY